MQVLHKISSRILMPAIAGILLATAMPMVLAFERTYTYQDSSFLGGRSATLAPERNLIRIGDEVAELRTCSTGWSDMCVASEYFVFIVPHDASQTNWNYEGINFERSIQTEIGDHSCLPKDAQQIVSVQGDATFKFYWSSQHQLLGWTLAYVSPDKERFVETYLDSEFATTNKEGNGNACLNSIFAPTPLVSANADRLYIEENGTIDWGIDVNISVERNTLRFGGSLVPLIVCSEPESKLCLESEYFNLLIPGDDSHQWEHGGFAFDLLPTTKRSPCPSLSLLHVQSDQAGRFFDFYWNNDEGLVAWRVAYAAADKRAEKLFVLERLRQQCDQPRRMR